MSEQKKPSNESATKLKVLEWLDKLATHFNVTQDEEQIKIFTHALRNCTPYQVEQAMERCLNECEFMPRLAQVHERIPEQKYATENPGRFVQKKPILELNRPIAEEICEELMGKSESELTPKERHELWAQANVIRYIRMGRAGVWLKPTEKQLEIASRKPFLEWSEV